MLAIPPSTWGNLTFDPLLPPELTLQMGWSRKWLGLLRDRFWTGHPAPASVAESGARRESIREATASQPAVHSPVLTAFLSGPAAEAWAGLPREVREHDLRQHFEARLPGFQSALRSTRWLDWPATPWTQAGDSFAAPGQLTRAGALLRRGLGRLQFAGEHTSTRFPGYMEGALESGVRVAEQLTRELSAAT